MGLGFDHSQVLVFASFPSMILCHGWSHSRITGPPSRRAPQLSARVSLGSRRAVSKRPNTQRTLVPHEDWQVRDQVSPGCYRNVSLIQFWILRVSRRLLLLWRRQSRPPSLTLATSTFPPAPVGPGFMKMPPPESPEQT